MVAIMTGFVPGSPKIAYDACGDGPLLVFMHGISSNRTIWHNQLAAFGERQRAVAWDARGFGLSDAYDGDLDFSAFADDLNRLLDHFKVETATLCGLSLGGRIALDFAARFPQRLSRLALCATFAGYGENFTPEKRAEAMRQRIEPLRSGKSPADIAPGIATSMTLVPGTPAYDTFVAAMGSLRPETYIKTIEGSTRYDRAADLAAIKVPTVLIFGANDTLTSPVLGREMAAKIPGASFVLIEGAGHMVNMQQPAAFNAALKDFLD